MPENAPDTAAVIDAIDRLERAMQRFEQVGHNILGTLEIHNEKLDAILAAAAKDAGPSEIAQAVQQVVGELQKQGTLLHQLPGELAKTIRQEMQREVEEEVEGDPDAYEPEGTEEPTGH